MFFKVINKGNLNFSVGLSDLTVIDIVHGHEEPYIGMEMYSIVNITNLDYRPARDVTLRFFVNSVLFVNKVIEVINYTECVELNLSWYSENSYVSLDIILDPYNNIRESNESNNSFNTFLNQIERPMVPFATLDADITEIIVYTSVAFNASGSKADTPITDYKYDFGDGHVTDWLNVSVINHTYTKIGIYYASVIIKDNYGQVSDSSTTIRIEVKPIPIPPVKPIAAFNYFYLPKDEKMTVITNITFSGTLSYSDDDVVTNCSWNFGDGTVLVTDMTPVSYIFSEDGIYNVTLVVFDSRGLKSDMASLIIVIENIDPTARIGMDKSEITSGERIIFSGAGTTDPDDDEINDLIYQWDFPDGTYYGRYITYEFQNPGEYIITLKVTDDDNGSHSISKTVNVIFINNTDIEEESEKDKELSFIQNNWIWVVSIGMVMLLLVFLAIKVIIERRKNRYQRLIKEHKELSSRVEKRQMQRSYKEARKNMHRCIDGRELMDFTINGSQENEKEGEIEYSSIESETFASDNHDLFGSSLYMEEFMDKDNDFQDEDELEKRIQDSLNELEKPDVIDVYKYKQDGNGSGYRGKIEDKLGSDEGKVEEEEWEGDEDWTEEWDDIEEVEEKDGEEIIEDWD